MVANTAFDIVALGNRTQFAGLVKVEPLTRMPCRTSAPVTSPLTTVTGVAIASAQGQAMTSNTNAS